MTEPTPTSVAGQLAAVLPRDCHREHSISFTQEPVGRNGGPYSKWEPCSEIAQEKARCRAARWPEHHRDDCAWCALVAAERDLYDSLRDQGATR